MFDNPYGIILKITFAAMFVSLLSCGSAQKINSSSSPKWLLGESNRYPNELYLTGIGQGRTLSVASNHARSELAKNIRVKVESSLNTRKNVVQVQHGITKSENIKRDTTEDITTSTDVNLQGITIVDHWFDPNINEYHSFAVLDRHLASNHLKKEISELDNQTLELMSKSRGDAVVLTRIGYLLKTKDLLRQRKDLSEYLRVIDHNSTAMTAAIDFSQVSQLQKELQDNVLIAVHTEGLFANEVTDFAHAALASSGFRTTTDAGGDYNLVIKIDLKNPQFRDKWFWMNGSVNVSLIDIKSNVSIGSHTWSIRQSSQDEAMVKRRVVDKIKNLLSQELGTIVLEFSNTN